MADPAYVRARTSTDELPPVTADEAEHVAALNRERADWYRQIAEDEGAEITSREVAALLSAWRCTRARFWDGVAARVEQAEAEYAARVTAG